MKGVVRFFSIALFSFFLIGCVGGTPTPQQESALGEQQERQILSQVRTIRHGPAYRTLGSVVSRIAQVSNRKDFRWRYHLVANDKVANAFVLPGGKVFVFTGLLPYAANEDELAVVVAHEVAHAMHSHGVKIAQKSQKAGLVGLLLNVGMAAAKVDPNTAKTVNQVYQTGASLGYIKPFSRKQELEADTIGLMLMAQAGYDPRAALSFWQKFSRVGGRIPEYLNTHPDPARRIANIKTNLPKALAIYKKNRYKKRRR